MKQIIVWIFAVGLMAAVLSGTARADESDGYFLPLKEKGRLIWTGQVQDSSGTWYDIRIVPGYTYPVRFGWRNLKEAGGNLAEYVESGKYEDMLDQNGNCLEWAFEDCLYEFSLEGAGKAWGKYFGRAENRVSKRVFGWWMAYPWAFMQSTVDNVVRIPTGLLGTALGTVSGIAVVPAYHLTNSSVKGVWNGGVEGLVLPASGLAWNTIAAPPLAIAGQQPAESRVDGFWVRIIEAGMEPGKEPDQADLAALAAWGILLEQKLEIYERQRREVNIEQQERIKELRKEMERVHRETNKRHTTINQAEKAHAENLLTASEPEGAGAHLRRSHWSASRVRHYQQQIREKLQTAGLSPQEINRIVGLLQKYPPGATDEKESSGRPEKTDPVTESIEVIKNID